MHFQKNGEQSLDQFNPILNSNRDGKSDELEKKMPIECISSLVIFANLQVIGFLCLSP
jgi:hypothetical protein